jgi:hypothetical protein
MASTIGDVSVDEIVSATQNILKEYSDLRYEVFFKVSL